MAIKKETLTSLRKDVKELKEQLEKTNKELESAKSNKEYYNTRATKAEAEVESIHSLLDVLPSALARKTVPDPEQTWKVIEHNLMTRFASYLALR